MSGALPPDASPDLIAEVRLNMTRGVGPRLRRQLIEAFGNAEQALAASRDDLQRVDGIGPKLAGRIANARHEHDAEAEIAAAAEQGVRLLTLADPAYPAPLRETPDPPGLLYVRGELTEADHPAVAIVGSRHATRYGVAQAERFAAGLARAGVTVVSGLARGVDGAAHRAALEAGGRTVAVLASGVLNIYPPEHEPLADAIAKQGAVVSEAPVGRPPLSGAFPQRNRVISGLSLGVLVVEAANRSGALITAHHAGEQGRDVFALPGPADSRLSAGCHALVRDGAILVSSVEELLEDLGPITGSPAPPTTSADPTPAEQEPAPPVRLNEVESRVFEAIATTPTEVDAVVSETGLPVARVLATISVLEMRGLLQRVSGALVARTR